MTSKIMRSLPTFVAAAIAVVSIGALTGCSQDYEGDCVDFYMKYEKNTEQAAKMTCRGLYFRYGGDGGWKNGAAYSYRDVGEF